jgi:hypothetical protein
MSWVEVWKRLERLGVIHGHARRGAAKVLDAAYDFHTLKKIGAERLDI